MVIKLVKVWVKPGQVPAFLAAQEVWNRETRQAPGYLGYHVGQDAAEPEVVYLHLFWRSRADLDAWMKTDHDRIAKLAPADEHYERIEVRVLDGLTPTATLPPGLLPENTLEAADIQTWIELYRAPAALRHAVRLRLFDRLADGPVQLDALAASLGVDPHQLHRLLVALCAMALVELRDEGWHNTPQADRLLVSDAPTSVLDMVLHITQPEYVERIFAVGEQLGLPADAHDPQEHHPRFMRAMSCTAAAGQADVLLEAVDLRDCRTLLDVGGATGPYAIPLCRVYPELRATILDQPETLPLAAPVLDAAGLGDRLQIAAHDFHTGPCPGPVDAALFSNVLRGETPQMIDDILRRARAALVPGGRILIPDLYVEDPPANPGLRAALFGLHLLRGANYTMRQMVDAVTHAGFEEVRAQRFTRSVVMNGIVEGRRPK
jgi:quinol monooxygenase YgiN